MNEEKETYIQHWKEQAKDQSRPMLSETQQRVQSDYLVSVRIITHRHLLMKYRPTGHRKRM